MYACAVMTVATVWSSLIVKGFWTVWDNTTIIAIVTLLKEDINFYMLLCGKIMH